MAKIYKGDVGTKLQMNAGCDISSASVLKIKYSKPNGNRGEWNATLAGTSSAYYVTKSGDLNAVGLWRIQLYVVLPDWSGHGETVRFRVHNILRGD